MLARNRFRFPCHGIMILRITRKTVFRIKQKRLFVNFVEKKKKTIKTLSEGFKLFQSLVPCMMTLSIKASFYAIAITLVTTTGVVQSL